MNKWLIVNQGTWESVCQCQSPDYEWTDMCRSKEYRKPENVETIQYMAVENIIIIIIIMNFYSPVSNTRCHSIGQKEGDK